MPRPRLALGGGWPAGRRAPLASMLGLDPGAAAVDELLDRSVRPADPVRRSRAARGLDRDRRRSRQPQASPPPSPAPGEQSPRCSSTGLVPSQRLVSLIEKGTTMSYYVEIDEGACAAHGDCVDVAPDVFELDDVARVIGTGPTSCCSRRPRRARAPRSGSSISGRTSRSTRERMCGGPAVAAVLPARRPGPIAPPPCAAAARVVALVAGRSRVLRSELVGAVAGRRRGVAATVEPSRGAGGEVTARAGPGRDRRTVAGSDDRRRRTCRAASSSLECRRTLRRVRRTRPFRRRSACSAAARVPGLPTAAPRRGRSAGPRAGSTDHVSAAVTAMPSSAATVQKNPRRVRSSLRTLVTGAVKRGQSLGQCPAL